MKRVIEIAASFTGTISTGSFENSKPFYSAKETLEIEEDKAVADAYIKDRQQELHKVCYDAFQRQAELSYQDKIAKSYHNIRFYEGLDGLKYPSVTSIIGWDADFHVSPDELAQYGARGTIIHKQVEQYLKTGEWPEPKDLPEIYPELVIVTKGTLGLELDNVDFPAFYKAYPFKVLELEKKLLNHEHRYGGRLDIKCIIESENPGKWDKVEGIQFDVPTILDVKTGTTVQKVPLWKQQTGYAKCEQDVEQIGVIHLNKEVKQGYSKPAVLGDLDKYWPLFLNDRENFRKRYNI